jgi:hypothetical protein
LNSYKDTKVNLYNNKSCSRDITIRRGVKQGCPLKPLLFNICIDPVFKFIKTYVGDDVGYKTKVLGKTYAHAYADDIVLMDSSRKRLQGQIDACDHFFNFANIKLNPNKCEAFKVSPKRKLNHNMKIGGEEIEFAPVGSYIKYLDVPLGSRDVEL